MAVSRRERVGLWAIAGLTSCVGIVNLLSAVTPSLPERVEWLRQVFPFEVRAGAHVFAATSGFMLLTLAVNLLRRKRVAWAIAVALTIVSVASNLVKGWDYEEGALSAVLLLVLVGMHRTFTARSDRPSVAQGGRVLVGAIAFTLAYGTAGFWLVSRQYSTNFDLWGAWRQTLAMFFTSDNAGLEPLTRFGRFFATSIYVVGSLTVTYAVGMLLRPVLFRVAASEEEIAKAHHIVEQYGRSSLACLTLLPDKSYYFSLSGRSAIAFVPKGRAAVALGDPIGPEDDRAEAIAGFREFCDRNDWLPAFYQVLPEDLDLYRKLGFRTLKVGEEGIVNLREFTLQGKAGKTLRASTNKLTKQGYRVEFVPPPIADDLLADLRAVSDEWLAHTAGSEKRFSLGWFDDDYLRECEMAIVRTADGAIAAFANLIPEYQRNEATIDLMRRRTESDRAVMDFLFVSLFETCKQRGYDSFNLGLSALAGVGATGKDERLEQGMRYLSEHLNRFYNFRGVHQYKEKFHPIWEPRYLIYPHLSDLFDVVVGLVRADSGDRLWDYLKPGN